MSSIAKTAIISGAKGEGKTSFARDAVAILRQRNISVGGFYSSRVLVDGKTFGYDIVDISNGDRCELLRIKSPADQMTIGQFTINPKGLAFGKEVLEASVNRYFDVILIDEVGRLELNGGGWAPNIDQLVNSGKRLIMAVRNAFVEQVIEKWKFEEQIIIPSNSPDREKILLSYLLY